MSSSRKRTGGSPRKKAKVWTNDEVKALREGINNIEKEDGQYQWSVIKEAMGDRLADRSTIDMKDKWRNLNRPPKVEGPGSATAPAHKTTIHTILPRHVTRSATAAFQSATSNQMDTSPASHNLTLTGKGPDVNGSRLGLPVLREQSSSPMPADDADPCEQVPGASQTNLIDHQERPINENAASRVTWKGDVSSSPDPTTKVSVDKRKPSGDNNLQHTKKPRTTCVGPDGKHMSRAAFKRHKVSVVCGRECV